MKAWLLDGYHGIESIHLTEVADPTAGPGEVLLKVRLAALNPADRYLAEAQYPAKPKFPHILGRECLGTINAVGPGVVGWKPGDAALMLPGEIGSSRWGTFAEQVVVKADALVPVPPGWSAEESAGAALVNLTAWQALTQWGELRAAVVLVTGASGGVGAASLQLASALGHQVVALTRSDAKMEVLRRLGAAIVLNCTHPAWSKTLRQQLGSRGVDLAIDNIGGGLLPQVIETLGMNGRVSLVGRLAGPVPQFNTASLFFKRLRLGGVAVSASSLIDLRADWEKLLHLLKVTAKRPIVDRVFAFEDLPAAFARLYAGPIGKVLLAVAK